MNTSSINIGRSTIFGNPVRIGAVCPVCKAKHTDPGSTGPCYRKYLEARVSADEKLRSWAQDIAKTIRQMPTTNRFAEEVKALHGKTLYCPGCGLISPTCHGRILEDVIQALNKIT
jgi:hypothetical protein